VTVHIPHSVVLALLALLVIAAVGGGAYAYGRHTRDADVRQGRLAAQQLVNWKRDAAIQTENTWRLMGNLCQEVIRLTPAAGYFTSDDCNHYGLTAPPHPLTTVEQQDEWFVDGLLAVCSAVERVQAPAGDLTRPRCNRGHRDLSDPQQYVLP
jgi:hypothetical protein